jgi:hypothetical protein
MPVLAAAVPAGASGAVVRPASRGGDNGDPDGPDAKKAGKQDNCPTEGWTVPLELKGLACILLLPKPENGEGGGGGLGGLLG